MKATNAWQQALKQAKGRYADLLAGSLVQAALRLLALCPLLGLLAPRTSPLKYLAALTPLAIVFVIFPLRASMAEAMADFMAGGKFCTKKLVSFDRYAEKLKNALGHAGLVLLWALPLMAAWAIWPSPLWAAARSTPSPPCALWAASAIWWAAPLWKASCLWCLP